jgi:hypothetical protein
MKKLAIFLAIMLIPFTAFALDTISDNDLNEVTGQAGVSIYTNSIQIVKTGVTTTYTDDDDTFNSQEANVVVGNATTRLFFKGTDPLMIDIVNMNTLATYLNQVGLTGALNDPTDYGDTGVMITLPNAIDIVNVGGATKTYYTGTVGDTNKVISIAVTGGTTTISHADQNWHSNGYVQDSVWANSFVGSSINDHTDQVGIIITAHEDL